MLAGGPWVDVWWTCSDHLLLLQVWQGYLLLDTVTDTASYETGETDLRIFCEDLVWILCSVTPMFLTPHAKDTNINDIAVKEYKWPFYVDV